MDPVGNYSKGIKKFASQMKKNGLKPQVIIYKGARHEILNELEKEKVYEDTLNFLNSCLI